MRLIDLGHSLPSDIHRIAHVNGSPRPEPASKPPTYRWLMCCVLAWLLVFVAGWDAIGFLVGGASVARATAFTLVNDVPQGLRIVGLVLLVIDGMMIFGLGRKGGKALSWSLTAGVTFYVFWAAVMFAGWAVTGEIDAWGAPGKSLAIAVIYYLIARTSPHPHETEG